MPLTPILHALQLYVNTVVKSTYYNHPTSSITYSNFTGACHPYIRSSDWNEACQKTTRSSKGIHDLCVTVLVLRWGVPPAKGIRFVGYGEVLWRGFVDGYVFCWGDFCFGEHTLSGAGVLLGGFF